MLASLEVRRGYPARGYRLVSTILIADIKHIFWKFTDGDGNAFDVEPVGAGQHQSVPVRYKGEVQCITGLVDGQFTLSLGDELVEKYERGQLRVRPDWMIAYLPNEPEKKAVFHILGFDIIDV